MCLVLKGDVSLLKKSIQAGALLEIKNKDGQTALNFAAQKQKCDMVDALIHAGADVNSVNSNGQTALMYVVQSKYMDVAKRLLVADADPNIHDSMGYSALRYASDMQNIDMIVLLLQFGADCNAISESDGWTSLMHAAFKSHLDVIRILLTHTVRANQTATTTNKLINFDTMKMTQHQVTNNDKKDARKVSDMTLQTNFIGTNINRKRIVLNINQKDKSGCTALLLAVKCNHLTAAKLLLKAGADVNKPDHNGQTPLMYATHRRYHGMIALLQKKLQKSKTKK
mmetsp:Transcript_25218/g.36223  ORF Transcript_25218/g.36223 Transcript_25218/m.36223 type:complete len:283 (+) Transcript_25218:633-1481(+)